MARVKQERKASPDYRALDLLIDTAPKIRGRSPFWRPAAPDVTGAVYVPGWQWRRPVTPADGASLIVLDANAAYLSAASSVPVAHGRLIHDKIVHPFERGVPGYWLTDWHEWPALDQIMSPLGGRGRSHTPQGTVWLTTPTMDLLSQLVDQGLWPDLEVYDSYTCETPCRLRNWADHVQHDRKMAMEALPGARDRYEAIKLGYSMAVTLLGKDETSQVFRPDWGHFIRAQHAASMWRRAWTFNQAYDRGLVAAGSVDELVFPRESLDSLWRQQSANKVTPLTVDATGVRLGAFHIKGRIDTGQTPTGGTR